jgi:tetratricopeptide (TPR) repeat protein
MYEGNQIYFDNATKNLNEWSVLSNKVIAHYGVPMKFSLGFLNGKGWYFFNEKEYQQAIKAWELLLKEYPAFLKGYLNIAYAQKELRQDYKPTLKRLKESLSSTKNTTPKRN